MSQQLDTLARVALCDAVRYTYFNQVESTNPAINELMTQLESACLKALELYGRLNPREIHRVNAKIDTIRTNTTVEKPHSIVSLIELSLAVIDEPCRRCKSERAKAMLDIAEILLKLRNEIAGGRDYALSSVFAGKAADIWENIEI